jgi:hypothetical protein
MMKRLPTYKKCLMPNNMSLSLPRQYEGLNGLKKNNKAVETQPAGARPVGYHSGRYQILTVGAPPGGAPLLITASSTTSPQTIPCRTSCVMRLAHCCA